MDVLESSTLNETDVKHEPEEHESTSALENLNCNIIDDLFEEKINNLTFGLGGNSNSKPVEDYSHHIVDRVVSEHDQMQKVAKKACSNSKPNAKRASLKSKPMAKIGVDDFQAGLNNDSDSISDVEDYHHIEHLVDLIDYNYSNGATNARSDVEFHDLKDQASGRTALNECFTSHLNKESTRTKCNVCDKTENSIHYLRKRDFQKIKSCDQWTIYETKYDCSICKYISKDREVRQNSE